LSATTRVSILRVSDRGDNQIEQFDDLVAVDRPLEICVDKRLLGSFWITQGMEIELAVGHLLASGIIESVSEIDDITQRDSEISLRLSVDRTVRLEASQTQRTITTSSGSVSSSPNLLDRIGAPRVESDLRIDGAAVLRMAEELNRRSETFRETGGTHSAMICTEDGEVLAHAEDVGRHNAVDKVIGAIARQGNRFSECVLVSSGRQSYEMVSKAARVGIPVVISQAGPLKSGIDVAEEVGITLVCFARGKRFNVYTHRNRVIFESTARA